MPETVREATIDESLIAVTLLSPISSAKEPFGVQPGASLRLMALALAGNTLGRQ